jgi:hypothetical protein
VIFIEDAGFRVRPCPAWLPAAPSSAIHRLTDGFSRIILDPKKSRNLIGSKVTLEEML